MLRKKIFLFLLILPVFSSLASADDTFPQSSRALAIDAAKYCSSDTNWLFSPMSASACLSMVYAGSDGQTARELSDALHLYLPQDLVGDSFHLFLKNLVHCPSFGSDFKLSIVQGIWAQTDFPLLDTFISSMRKDFEAKIESIDFSLPAIERINGWISEQTEQKIRNLLNPGDVDSTTKLVLANALYFKGSWVNRFQTELTELSPFTTSHGETKDVKTMNLLAHFKYFEDSDCQAVFLPFQKERSTQAEPCCLLILPKHSEAPFQMSVAKLDQILASCETRMVRLQIPKFQFEQRFDLQDWLKQLGIQSAFSPQADFSKMDGRMDLCLSKTVQKCFFSLDEQGVEAAAATAAVMNCKCCNHADEVVVSFIADQPFEFLLIDQNSKTCLMLGHVADPM